MARRYTYQDVKEYIENFGYKLLSKEYKNNKTSLIVECPNGHIVDTLTFDNFKNQGKRCKYCGKQKVAEIYRTPYEEVKEYIESFGYKLLSKEYINAHKNIIVQPPCDHESYEVTFAAFKYQNQRCPKCANEHRNDDRRLTYEYVKTEFKKEGYELLSTEYTDTKQNLLVKCPNGHVTDTMTYGNFQQGKRCSRCKESKGEKEVANTLENHNIRFITQYKFDDCRSIKPLPFDFYLPDYNVCIEFDGQQHYRIVEYWGGLDSFVSRIIRDTIKNEYCKKNNIKLIRIRYEEMDNIEKILIDELDL